jgi:hypothetical protein
VIANHHAGTVSTFLLQPEGPAEARATDVDHNEV